MPYNITLSNGTDLITGGLLDNTTDSVNSSLTLVGKNYKGYGLFLNQNFARLMENFALGTAPAAPLPGQLWFNSSSKLLNVNISTVKGTASAIWKTVAGMTISATTPTNAFTGEQWYDTTSGQLKLYTGTNWRLIGPLNTLATGNTGAIPDTITDAPPSTTFVVIKFFIDNVLAGIWSKDGPFASDVPGFSTIRKGLNLNSTLGQAFWGTAEVANSLIVSGNPVAGTNFLRNDSSGTINGSLSLTNDGGIIFGAASDFVGSVSSGTVTLRNQTNNRDLILSVRSGGIQTSFLKGNATTGLSEAFTSPTALSPALSLATKNYVDILSGSVNGTANFFGNLTPSTNLFYTLGNSSNRWSSLFTDNIQTANITATNMFATNSNVAQLYLGADLLPTANISSNVGSTGMRFRTIHAVNTLLTGTLNVATIEVSSNSSVNGNAVVGANLTVTGNSSIVSINPATSTSTGALIVAGGVGIGGNLHVGGTIIAQTLPAGTSNTAVATTAFVQNSLVPTGSLMMWPTVAAPSGYLLCNGSAVSRITFAGLFAVIGTTFGVGDGSTTFNLPNYTNRLPVGAGGLYGLGTTGGSKDSTVVSHTHTLSGGSVSGTFVTGVTTSRTSFQTDVFGSQAVTNVSTTTGSPSYTNPTVQSSGSSGTDTNMPPYLAINFIIKT